jgi:hypothetical protein
MQTRPRVPPERLADQVSVSAESLTSETVPARLSVPLIAERPCHSGATRSFPPGSIANDEPANKETTKAKAIAKVDSGVVIMFLKQVD